jgi:hypothetical protein
LKICFEIHLLRNRLDHRLHLRLMINNFQMIQELINGVVLIVVEEMIEMREDLIVLRADLANGNMTNKMIHAMGLAEI